MNAAEFWEAVKTGFVVTIWFGIVGGFVLLIVAFMRL